MPKRKGNIVKSNGTIENDLPAGLARPAKRALENAGYIELWQFTKLTEAEMLQLHGVGPKATGLIRSALKAKGLSFIKD
ncbi:DNA-binding protein [bacterium LRH843]|nr:DNA-binding protein [bacterium LRH843]